MAIMITCTSCNSRLRVADELLGTRVQCPGCGFTFLATTTITSEQGEPPAEQPRAPRRSSRSNDAIRKDAPPPRECSSNRDDEDEDSDSQASAAQPRRR
jgi:hypothetical protein